MYNFNHLFPSSTKEKEEKKETVQQPEELITDSRLDMIGTVMAQKNFSSETKLIYSALASLIDFKPTLTLSIHQLATKLGLSPKTICHSINQLIEYGYLTIRKGIENGEVVDYYQLNRGCEPCCFRKQVVSSVSSTEKNDTQPAISLSRRERYEKTEWPE